MIPTPINRLPNGLLGFLGIKNGGRYPSQMGDQLAPGWDLERLYLQTNSEYLEALPNAAALGYLAAFTVPNGEYWYVHEYGIYSAALGAGQSITAALAIRDPGGSISVLVSPTANATAVGTRMAIGQQFDRVFTPGASVGLYVTQLAAGPVAFSADLRFSRMGA